MKVNGYVIEPKADLRNANLRYADLRNANLRNTDLQYADLRNANLRYADLRYADLRNADLRGAKNFHLLPIQDPRGWSWIHAVKKDRTWLIVAGCRRLTIHKAKQHWGPNYQGERAIGDMYLKAISWLEEEIKS